jgi:putative hydrolase of the HAD superfamily
MNVQIPSATIDTIAFDADDTLWHSESLFGPTRAKLTQLLLPFHSEEWIGQKLYETELKNLAHFGYGVKGFVLSMIETAIELSEGKISGAELMTLIEAGKGMLRAPIQLLDGVRELIPEWSLKYQLIMITKGDLFDQESKIARSGLGEFFDHVEIVSGF